MLTTNHNITTDDSDLMSEQPVDCPPATILWVLGFVLLASLCALLPACVIMIVRGL